MSPRQGPAEEWTASQCAEHIGVSPRTWRSYAARGNAGAPAPRRHVGRTPVWDADEVRTWAASRPGRGNWGARPSRQQ
ncbi:hypothetical protein CWT12_01530 [Actinomyces sp. 432]|uniref:helix-turn-helix transcriptional regulator n=1 Tax=Actinomyces sp. 432 TaxID=2057798 RepID=UPI00137404CA|nr:hypothetical protein [Actinomyces sp. 432]QHO90283.1 hypothetical protein CWT12_01530 [Actinomyces sp. 432]